MNKLKQWYHKYERWLIPGALVVGFTVDAITFRSIDLELSFLFLLGYLTVALIVITFMHLYDAGVIGYKSKVVNYLRLFSPIIVQYSFGALLSGFLIFYGFNSVFSTSWPFILIIVILMVSNDLLKKYYLHTTVQFSVYYFILFSFLALVLPYVFKSLSVWVFILSGIGSFFIIRYYIRILSDYVPNIKFNYKYITWGISVIFLAMNLFYFTNIIPPIPLSLKQSGVYHQVERQVGSQNYNFRVENQSWLDEIRLYPRITYENEIYVYSSVFAPINLKANVVHHWQYYDESTGQWINRERISFPITGGRDGGYRGYSKKENIQFGFWAVDIETERGRDIGRVRFKVVEK